MAENLSPIKSYFIQAVFDWILDNNCTPYLLVDASCEGTSVPQQFVNGDGRIILNISPEACRGLHLNHDEIVFSARFSSKVEQVVVPPLAVKAIYAKENGKGMEFDSSYDTPYLENTTKNDKKISSKKKPNLKLVDRD